MQLIAAEVGYSETVFATPANNTETASPNTLEWRGRYIAPEIEVPFCGHATLALGAALALRHGDARFSLHLNHTQITVEENSHARLSATLQSPPTRSESASSDLVAAVLSLFN